MPPSHRIKMGSAVAALVVLPVLWWWPLLAGYLPDFMDTVTHLYAWRIAVARQLSEGTLPLWAPNQFAGIPIAANPQIAVWYPPHLIFYLLPNPIGNGIVLLFHYWLGGLGAFAITRRLAGGHHLLASLFAGLIFQFGSMLISRIALTPHLYTAAWAPWILVAVDHAAGRPALRPNRATLCVGLLFALQLLAGGPQISYYMALILPIWWLVRATQLRTGGEPLTPRLARACVQGLTAAFLAALLASIQIIPTLVFLRETARSEIPLEKLRELALHGPFLWRSLVGWTGNPIEDTDSINAIGFGALLLVGVALWRRRTRPPAMLLVGIGILSWLLSVGFLLDIWSRLLPGYQGFHAPRRALILWSITGPIAAGLGAAVLAAWCRCRRLHRAVYPGLLVILFAGTAWILPRLEREFVLPDRFDPGSERIEILGDARYITIDPTMNYSYGSRSPDYGISLMPNLAVWHDLYDAQGYDPLIPKRLWHLREYSRMKSINLFPSHGVFFTEPTSPVLDLLSVQYLVGRYDLFNPSRVIKGASIDIDTADQMLTKVLEAERWPIWRYNQDRPLAWTVEAAILAESPENAMVTALSQPDRRKLAFVEEPVDVTAHPDPVPVESATWENDRTLSIRLANPPRLDTFTVASVNWLPGWRAQALPSGEPLTVYPANGALIGAVVPEGSTGVRFVYAPRSFRYGVLLTMLGLLLLALGWYVTRRQ